MFVTECVETDSFLLPSVCRKESDCQRLFNWVLNNEVLSKCK